MNRFKCWLYDLIYACLVRLPLGLANRLEHTSSCLRELSYYEGEGFAYDFWHWLKVDDDE